MARDGWNPFANSADNNGNVLRQLHYVPLSGGGNVIPQLDDYNYDALNRVTSVSELASRTAVAAGRSPCSQGLNSSLSIARAASKK
ncbi:MAG: hypothetical protein U0X75_04045 [Acidobacteriota bacterium]